MTRRTSLAISLIFGGGHMAIAFVSPSPSLLLSPSGAGHSTHASTTGGRIAGTGSVATHAAASTRATTRRREDVHHSTCIHSRQQRRHQSGNGPLHMFVGFQDDRAPRDHERGRQLPGNDPYGRDGYSREDFRGIHSHDIPWREHMPNAANDDGLEAYPVLWQYAQNGNWNEVYTRILDHPEEATYEVNGWTPLHLLVAGNGMPVPLAVVRAVYAAHPDALHKRTDHYGRTPLEIAVRWDQPREVIEFLADPTILELGAGDEEEEFLMLQQQQQQQLGLPGNTGNGRRELAASPDVIDAMTEREVVEPPQQQQQQQRAVGYEKPPPISTGDGLDNGWASGAVSVNGNSRRSFVDDTTAAAPNGDYEASFGDNVHQQQQQRPATAPKANRVQVVGPSYAGRPSEAVSNNYYDPSPPPKPKPEYVEPTNINVPYDNYNNNYNSAAVDEEAEYFAAIQKQYYGGGAVEVETTTAAEYMQPVDVPDTVVSPTNEDQDSTGMKPIEPEIVGGGGIEHISNSEDDEDDEEVVRVVEADVILDDNQFEEEIYNKKIMEEVRLQQYEDEMAVLEAQDRMKQRASSRASWGNWGARHGHSWMNR